MKMLKQAEIRQVFDAFKAHNSNPQTELIAPNAYTLLVAVILSAQATDKSVNKATESLFKVADTPEKMVALGAEKLEDYIKSIGLYHAKARHVIEMSRQLIENYGSAVPDTREKLESLSGVGRKTANVILNVVYRQKTMPVDTHILRIAPRIGLAAGKTPEKVEQELVACIPDEYMEHAHHWLILHGRYVCTAKSPKCAECCIRDVCAKNGV
ncbi:MAG: endonuclease III [Treponemataceae bacterium]|nr:endonuclease III [Treponemataceae bacterium]